MKLPATIVFATNNSHKLREVRDIVGNNCEVKSLAEIGCHDDIPETAETLEGNALIKARWVKERYGYDCFAGAPGVKSARYAAEEGVSSDHDSLANMEVLLRNMEGKTDRNACFRTAIALIAGGEEHCFEGRVDGCIIESPRGSAGYDPVFVPAGYDKTFAEMSEHQKNSLSHRRRALDRLMEFFDK